MATLQAYLVSKHIARVRHADDAVEYYKLHPEEVGASSVLCGVDDELYALALRWEHVRREETNAKLREQKKAKPDVITQEQHRERMRQRGKARWDAMTAKEKRAHSAKQWAQQKARKVQENSDG